MGPDSEISSFKTFRPNRQKLINMTTSVTVLPLSRRCVTFTTLSPRWHHVHSQLLLRHASQSSLDESSQRQGQRETAPDRPPYRNSSHGARAFQQMFSMRRSVPARGGEGGWVMSSGGWWVVLVLTVDAPAFDVDTRS